MLGGILVNTYTILVVRFAPVESMKIFSFFFVVRFVHLRACDFSPVNKQHNVDKRLIPYVYTRGVAFRLSGVLMATRTGPFGAFALSKFGVVVFMRRGVAESSLFAFFFRIVSLLIIKSQDIFLSI